MMISCPFIGGAERLIGSELVKPLLDIHHTARPAEPHLNGEVLRCQLQYRCLEYLSLGVPGKSKSFQVDLDQDGSFDKAVDSATYV